MKDIVNKYIRKRIKEEGAKFRKVNKLAPNEKAAVVLNGSVSTNRISVIQHGDKLVLQELLVYSDIRLMSVCVYRKELS